MLKRDHVRLENLGLDHSVVNASVSLINNLSTLTSQIFHFVHEKHSNNRKLLSFECFHFCDLAETTQNTDKF